MTHKIEIPELLDARAAAALLGVSTRTVWRMRDAGVCPAPLKILGAVRWRRRELLEWLDAGAPNLSRQSGRARPATDQDRMQRS